MFISPINSNIKNLIGAKNHILFGFSVVAASTVGLGIVTIFDNPHYFMYATLVLRFFQGGGDTMVQVTFYNILTEVYSDDLVWIFRWLEIAVNSGFALGPMVGDLFIDYFNYSGTMYFMGGLNFLNLILCIFMIPNAFNEK